MVAKDVESGQKPAKIPHMRMVIDQGCTTSDIENYAYKGKGTEEDPYVVTWIRNDPRNPQLFSETKKWSLTAVVAIATLAVAFCSSAYSGGVKEIIQEFGASQEVAILGVSLFVLGFAIGPLIWAPLSELFGRQYLFIGTFAALTAFNAGAAGSKNMATLIVLRFFAGAFGSSPLTNSGGVIADMFSADERGIALSIFAAAPFLGPVLGPIVGGFVGETVGWRWIEGVMAILSGVLWILGSIVLPETYPPVLLRQRAARLSKITGKVYRSQMDVERGPTTFSHVFKTSLLRPWVLLCKEPIVLLLSLYMAIIYGVLYMLFSAFPIVYQTNRGWSAGIGGLAFLGVAVGMFIAVTYSVIDNKRYVKVNHAHNGFAPPEARLPPGIVGAFGVTIGLFWFAWTSQPSIHYMASIAAGVPFGFGMVLVFLAIMNYLIDAYVIFAASVLAANAVLRSVFGAVFPLFTTQMLTNLGTSWGISIPAFLSLACLPLPYLFYKFGPRIRVKCKYAKEANEFLHKLQDQKDNGDDESDQEEKRQEAFDDSYEDEGPDGPRFAEMRTAGEQQAANSTTNTAGSGRNSLALKRTRTYQGNPYDIDRVATRESFGRSRASSRAGSTRTRN